MSAPPRAIILMGVSGCGKTTLGRLVASRLGVPFLDADDFHSTANIEKMRSGIPLTDQDRAGWLRDLNQALRDSLDRNSSVVLACSALRDSYRTALRQGLGEHVRFAFLHGPFALIEERLRARKGHYMPAQLLQSQFEALEIPSDALLLPIEQDPDSLATLLLQSLNSPSLS